MLTQILLILFAYVLGSISSAILTCKLFKLPDPRTQGSNNPGATNVLRIGGKLPAIITLLGDGLKGAIPTTIAVLAQQNYLFIAITMLAAILGHLYPLFFKFKGGKGVATFIGGLLILSWQSGLGFLAIWLLIFVITRISSLSALIATILTPVMIYIVIGLQPLIPILIMVGLILYKHSDNISRLLQRKEKQL